MDNETLKRLFKAGAILLVLDAPHNQLEFGIDVNCWNTGPRFKGIKLIPPGAHFVYYSLHNTKSTQPFPESSSGSQAQDTLEVTEGSTTGGDVRIGFWHQFESGEVIVMKWNAYNEEMELEKDKDQVARFKAGIQEFDPFLGSYPLLPPDSTYPSWLKLSSHITKVTIERVFPAEGFVNSHDDLLEEELARASRIIDRQQREEREKAADEKFGQTRDMDSATVSINREDDAEKKNNLEAKHAHNLSRTNLDPRGRGSNDKDNFVKFTPIDLRSSFRKGAVGEEVPAFLGEYQVSFVTMLLSYHLGAFRQWKSMTILVCQSTEAILSPNYTRLFSGFIETLHQQLSSIPSNFFMDLLFASPDQGDMTANFLEQGLKMLGRNVQAALRRGQCLELRRPMHALQKAVLESFEWKIPGDFKKIQQIAEITQTQDKIAMDHEDDDDYEEEGEYAPVIVE
ncbi:a1-alpha2 repression [Modicella reniformis]|uniref:A1-alpha2 repression n=1 Tax=Modicella reniformis TaxID=1440133 RepID=A0A9P6LUF8_9FUNG|nr:a1-alpha2 repression [Modicella reniformis]